MSPVAPERAPRRARYLLPRETPRRAEFLAVLTLLLLLAGALFAQVTLLAAVLCLAVGKASRWHPWWLAAPAACGLVWALADVPAALTGLAAAPRAVAVLLSGAATHAVPASRLATVPEVVARRLAGQVPLGLVAGAGVAAFSYWLSWLHTNEWEAQAPRPGLVRRTRRAWNTASLRAGGVVSVDGANLGVEPATGRLAAVSWQQARRGVLVTGAGLDDVTATGLQFVRAAVRRRSAVIVADLTGAAPSLRHVLTSMCGDVGAPLQEVTDASVEEVIERRAVGVALLAIPGQYPAGPHAAGLNAAGLNTAGSRDEASVVTHLVEALAAVYTGKDGGLAPDVLLWVNGCEDIRAGALAPLAAAGSGGRLAWVLGTTDPAAAARIAGQAGVCVAHRLTDTTLAGQLASRGGARWVPSPAPGDGVDPGGWQAGHLGPFGIVAVPDVAAASLAALGEREFLLFGNQAEGLGGTVVRAHAGAPR